MANNLSKLTYVKAITRSTMGNMLEWFDFAVYGYMALYIGPLFFPSENVVISNLSAFSVFAVGYIARPFGAVVLGRIGDRIGRRYMLILSISLIGFSSLAIGLLPTHQTVGILAPILLILCRLLQGFSVGGEYTGAMTYASELANRKKRGFVNSFPIAGCTAGILMASGTVWLINHLFGDKGIAEWGWRIPFYLGAVVALVGYWISRNIPETAEIKAENSSEDYNKLSLGQSLVKYWKQIFSIIFISTGANIVFYMISVFALGIASKQIAQIEAEEIITYALAISVPSTILGGWLSDIFGRRKVSLILNIIIGILIIPVYYMCFELVTWPISIDISPKLIFILGQVLLTIPVGMVIGVQGTMIAEILPKNVRCTIFSIAYSLAMGIFAGSSLMVAEYMYNFLDWHYGPALYSLFWTVMAIVCIFKLPDTTGKEIN